MYCFTLSFEIFHNSHTTGSLLSYLKHWSSLTKAKNGVALTYALQYVSLEPQAWLNPESPQAQALFLRLCYLCYSTQLMEWPFFDCLISWSLLFTEPLIKHLTKSQFVVFDAVLVPTQPNSIPGHISPSIRYVQETTKLCSWLTAHLECVPTSCLVFP